jgi:hypothetical protein
VFERILGQKRGIVMGVWNETDEFHNASLAANVTSNQMREDGGKICNTQDRYRRCIKTLGGRI